MLAFKWPTQARRGDLFGYVAEALYANDVADVCRKCESFWALQGK